LFRTVLEDAFQAQGIPCTLLVEKTAYATAATSLRKSLAEASALPLISANSTTDRGALRKSSRLWPRGRRWQRALDVVLFGAKRGDRIDAGRALRRQIARRDRDT
jgi:hypothetical protein